MNSNVLYFLWFHMRLWWHNLQLMTYTVLNSLYFSKSMHISLLLGPWGGVHNIHFETYISKPFWHCLNDVQHDLSSKSVCSFDVPDKLSVFHKCQERVYELCVADTWTDECLVHFSAYAKPNVDDKWKLAR